MSKLILFSLSLVLLISSPLQAQNPPPMPTMDDLRQMYQAKQYRVCLQQIARVVRQANLQDSQWDKYALMLMRADCLLHLDDGAAARQMYEQAEQSPDEMQWARGRAMAYLVSRSPGFKYTPRAGGATIDITQDANQASAMQALLADDLQSPAGLRRAMDAQNIEPVVEFVPQVQNLYALELVATGKTDQVQPMVREVGQHARDLIQREINTIGQKMQNIQGSSAQSAGGQPMEAGGAWWVDPAVVRRGLFPEERQYLNQVGGYLERIAQTAQRGQKLSMRLGGEADAWGALVTQTQQLQNQAQQILSME